jgi:diguanylate cyclase (GGDEF)-like protein/PAS domain S-box-containing protein
VQGYSVDHKVTYWNSYSTELYGYSSEEALGEKIEDLIIPDEMCNEVRHAIDNFITTEIGIPSAEVLLKHEDGSMLPVYSQYILIKDYNSRPEMFCLDIDLRELKETQATLDATRELAIRDDLTGLFNRFYYNLVIDQEIRRARRDANYLVYAMLDIDNFKQYNDTYGHPAGDKALKKLGEILSASMSRPGDLVFRLGGEEFCIIYSSNLSDLILRPVDNLMKKLEDENIRHKKNESFGQITLSAGIVVLSPRADYTLSSVYARADELLYKAKNAGRNTIFHERIDK